jgi:hypothetical protein
MSIKGVIHRLKWHLYERRSIAKALQDKAPNCTVCGKQYQFIGKGLYEGRCECKEENDG